LEDDSLPTKKLDHVNQQLNQRHQARKDLGLLNVYEKMGFLSVASYCSAMAYDGRCAAPQLAECPAGAIFHHGGAAAGRAMLHRFHNYGIDEAFLHATATISSGAAT